MVRQARTRSGRSLLSDVVFWPVDGAQSLTPESQLLAGVLGVVMAGRGIMVLLVVVKVYSVDPGLARSIILPSVWVWFAVDRADRRRHARHRELAS